MLGAGIFLAIVMLASLWLQYVNPSKTIAAAGMLAGVLFTAVVIVGMHVSKKASKI